MCVLKATMYAFSLFLFSTNLKSEVFVVPCAPEKPLKFVQKQLLWSNQSTLGMGRVMCKAKKQYWY